MRRREPTKLESPDFLREVVTDGGWIVGRTAANGRRNDSSAAVAALQEVLQGVAGGVYRRSTGAASGAASGAGSADARRSGTGGRPARSLMTRKRTTPSAIRR